MEPEKKVGIEVKYIIFQMIIVIPFFTGFFLKRLSSRFQSASKKMVTVNLSLFEPPIVFWSIWGLTLSREMVVLPFLGFLIVMGGFFFGLIVSSFLNFQSKEKKTFVISASLANHGFTMGGFLCYLAAGETGLALSAIFLLYFIPFTFLFIFGYAGYNKKKSSAAGGLIAFVFTMRNMPLFAAIMALALNLFHVERPDIAFPLDTLLIISVSLYYFTLGTNFEPADLRPLKAHHVALSLEKFMVIPALIYLGGGLLGLDPHIRQVISIQSFMPAAIYSVVTSIMFDLDARLASSLFVVNSLVFILVVLPFLGWVRPAFLFLAGH